MSEESGRAIVQNASVDDSLTFGEADPTITSLEDVHLDSTLVLVGCGASKRDPEDPTDLHLASVPEGGEIPGHGTGPAWRAEDLYTSTYFAVKREFAEVVTAWANSRDATPWAILSAEHDILPHWQNVPRYDTTIDDLGDDPENPDHHVDSSIVRRRPDGREIVTEMDLWATNVAYGLARWLSGYRDRDDAALTSRVNSLLVLVGQDYIQQLRERGVFKYGISRMAGDPNENLAQLDADVRFLFEEIDASGIGEQMGWLSDTVDTLEPLVNDVEETEQDTFVTDGGEEVGQLVICKNCGDEHHREDRKHRAASSFCPECGTRGGYVLDKYREEFATDGGQPRAEDGRAIQQSLVGEQLTRPKCKPPGLHGDRCENDVDRVISVYYGGPAMTTIEWKVCDDHADEVRETGEVREDREYQENRDGFAEVGSGE